MNARSYALMLLAKQDYTVSMMRERLHKKLFSDDEVSSTIAFLTDNGLIDDLRYAKNYVESKKNQYGSVRLAFFLRQKGIPDGMIDSVIAEEDSDFEYEAAVSIVRRLAEKNPSAAFDAGTKKKWISSLYRKGYCYEIASGAVERVIRETEGI